MKDKSSIQKNSSFTEDKSDKHRIQKDQGTNGKQKIDAEHQQLHTRASKRSNYHNDGPGGGYDGL